MCLTAGFIFIFLFISCTTLWSVQVVMNLKSGSMCACTMIASIYFLLSLLFRLEWNSRVNTYRLLDWRPVHVSVHTYDYDHTCVTGVRCLIDVSRNTEIKKMEREREREKWARKGSVQGPCVGECCFAQTLEAYQQSSHCFSVSSQLYRTEAIPLLFPLLLQHHNSNCPPFYCLPILLSSCPPFSNF